MLAACLHKLCAQDSFESLPRKVKLVRKSSLGKWKIDPRRVQNCVVEASRELLDATLSPYDHQDGSETEFGTPLDRSWDRLGLHLGALPS